MATTKKSNITATIKEQILEIRDSSATNMFDTRTVQRIAFDNDMYELVCFIQDNKKEYVNFILFGDENEERE